MTDINYDKVLQKKEALEPAELYDEITKIDLMYAHENHLKIILCICMKENITS